MSPETQSVIAIWLGAGGGKAAADQLRAIRERHRSSRLILLTTQDAGEDCRKWADETWHDGALKGAGGFLARARRLSWASPGHIYDLEGSRPTRLLRLCVWPRPHWHRGAGA
ncbi:MAG: hypothetical protein K9G30_09245 [Parvibaculum sp.]|nr:hypothetical protein [Parvibaculum sp.]